MNPNNIPFNNNIWNINSNQMIAQDNCVIKVELKLGEGNSIIINSKSDEKIGDICQKCCIKFKKDINKLQFLYSGKNIIEMDKLLSDIINQNDKERKMMTVIVWENSSVVQKNNKNMIKANYIICPICKESALINFQNYKIKLFGCKKGHTSIILLNEFEDSQKIDESNIICNICGKNKKETYNNIIYICNTCNMNLCPLCKEKHDKSHNFINYERKNYNCILHNRPYSSFCNSCKKDLCVLCESEHELENHKIIFYSKIIPKIDLLNNSKKVIKELVKNFDTKRTELINKINNIKTNFEIYSQLIENMVNNYNDNNINFNILRNLYDISKLEEQNIYKDFNKINNSMNDFLIKINNIYEQMNGGYGNVDNNTKYIMNNNYQNINNIKNNIISNFPKENNQILNIQKSQDHSQIKKNKYIFPTKGLRNISSSFYLNATLQCLLHVSDLVVYFLDEFPKEYKALNNKNKKVKTKGDISRCFYNLINGVCNFNIIINKSAGNNDFSPEEIKRTLGLYNIQFKDFENNEPKNLVLYLLQIMHQELNNNGDKNKKLENNPDQSKLMEAFNHFRTNYNNNNESIISLLFFGTQKNKIQCENCRFILYSFHKFEMISFSMQNYHNTTFNILEGFKGNSEPFFLAPFFCQNCNFNTKKINTQTIFEPPNNLLINIDYGKNYIYKPSKVEFNDEIDITQFVDFDYNQRIKYMLICVCSYYGYNQYAAFCRNRDNNWYEFNDSFCGRCDKNKIYLGRPYLLLYERIFD